MLMLLLNCFLTWIFFFKFAGSTKLPKPVPVKTTKLLLFILTTTGINSPFTVEMFLKRNVTMRLHEQDDYLLVCDNIVQNPTFHDVQMAILQPRVHCDPVIFV